MDDVYFEEENKINGTEKKHKKGEKSTPCDTCFYFEEDECTMDLDEDELYRYEMRTSFGAKMTCPYYKFYDEYKSVQKQN